MKTLITFFDSFAINWPVIWSDASIYVCFFLYVLCLITYLWAKNYRHSIREEYLVKTTSKLAHLHGLIDEKERENKFLSEAFAEYRTDAQNEAFERQERINQLETKLEASKHQRDVLKRELSDVMDENMKFKADNNTLHADNISLRTQLQGRRNPDGTFAKTTGKGHGRKTKTEPAAPAPDRDWTTATPEELLAEAKRKYPVGTRYADVLDSVEYESKWEPWIYEYSQSFKGIAICVTDGGGFVYAKGHWAQILP